MVDTIKTNIYRECENMQRTGKNVEITDKDMQGYEV